ncbi:60S ribosomal protein L38 [Penicillium argentinense]|uniref:60S ribosomal protein L38 n=1 Tax=Penicillium argentinense TaxID=1131581 RepID=A0A9W9K3F6_9EURO|nr:60S ribosomal protein L38 [Penicillium argentinense]KAJ5090722.1 60S ribosomal protein L38 [Penicillium argentinense]
MPSEVSDIKQFIEICRRKDASSARIKRNRKSQQIKFKVRCHRNLYTLVLKDSDKADKLKQSLPPALKVVDVSKGDKKKSL